MKDVDITAASTISSPESAPWTFSQPARRALLTGFLFLVCSAAHVVISGQTQDVQEIPLGAAVPRPDHADVNAQDQLEQAADSQNTNALSAKIQKVSNWKIMHLRNRHYATLDSTSNTTKLNYLCMRGVSCGWVMNLKDESNCNSTNKGTEFRIRMEAGRLIRDFNSRCAGYGLIYLGIEAGDAQHILDMVTNADKLRLNSVGGSGVFRTQYFQSYGAAAALNTAIISAGLQADSFQPGL